MSHRYLESFIPPKVSVDYVIDVKGLIKDMEKKLGAIFLEFQREENIKRNNQERREQYLLERLRKRRLTGQSYQSNVNNKNKTKELIPTLVQAPAPVPPSTSKEVLYSKMENTELFKDLEDFATHLESKNVTFVVLMNRLLVRELTELERVRILFHWISSQDLNAIHFSDNVLDDSPYGHLKSIREDRSTYASLFQRLCKAAGIHCKTILGYLKGVGYFPDHSFQKNPSEFVGEWNAVLILGEWRLINTDWGARHVIENSSNDKRVYKYNEHYFLTDPDKMITSHFPEAPEWQLLHRPKTLEQFENAVQNWSPFYDLKISHASHYNGLITTDIGGHVQIKLRVPSRDYKFKFKIRWRYEYEAETYVKGSGVLWNSDVIFDVYLPENNDFILTLYGGKYGETFVHKLCRYQVIG